MNLLHALLLAWTVLLALPAALLLLQVLLACAATPRRPIPITPRGRVAVLIPAHDESSGLLPTLRSVRHQLRGDDRLLVVADNCRDDTAAVARAAGAEVCERMDAALRGKGHALAFGVRVLANDPPDVLIVVDADCLPASGCIDRLARCSLESGRPAQAAYRLRAPDASLSQRIGEFAVRVKNLVRPRGMQRLGLPCGLYGTGMAFPWVLARSAPFASGHLAEDMQLGLQLAAAGTPPLYCEEARIESHLAASRDGAASQRTRWEHGHLALLLHAAPGWLYQALISGDGPLLALVLDLCVPPLALLAALLGATLLATAAVGVMGGGWLPLAVSTTATAMLIAALLIARARFAADIVSAADLLRAARYVLSKLPLYWRFVVRRQLEWVRTSRKEAQ